MEEASPAVVGSAAFVFSNAIGWHGMGAQGERSRRRLLQ
jgi:hypothetical protein